MMPILIFLHGHVHDFLLGLRHGDVDELLHAAVLDPLMNHHLAEAVEMSRCRTFGRKKKKWAEEWKMER